MTQNVDNAKRIAAEYFGAAEGRTVSARSDGNDPTAVVLTVGGGDIDGDNEAELTFTLTGATFASRVALGQFRSSSENVSVSLNAGGLVLDNKVTVDLEVSGGALANASTITFTLPDLQVIPEDIDGTDEGVTVDASIATTRSRGDSFPDMISADGETGGDGDPMVVYTVRPATSIGLNPPFADGVKVTGLVDLMNRKVLAGGTEDAPATLILGRVSFDTISASQVVGLEEYSSTEDEVISYNTNNTPEAAGLGGKLVVTSTGNFQTDDKVMIGEMELERNDDRSFSGSIATADAQGTTFGLAITYVPGGVDDLLPGTFNTTVAVRYDDELNASGPVDGQTATVNIEYEGLSVAGYAYGIVKAGGAARTYLRVACAGAMDCNLFASCRDQAGESYFGELGAVAAGGVEVYDSDEIGEALGGGWRAGRGRCDLLSNGALEVQNMLHQGNTRTNNSMVISGGPTVTVTATSTATVIAPADILDRTQ